MVLSSTKILGDRAVWISCITAWELGIGTSAGDGMWTHLYADRSWFQPPTMICCFRKHSDVTLCMGEWQNEGMTE